MVSTCGQDMNYSIFLGDQDTALWLSFSPIASSIMFKSEFPSSKSVIATHFCRWFISLFRKLYICKDHVIFKAYSIRKLSLKDGELNCTGFCFGKDTRWMSLWWSGSTPAFSLTCFSNRCFLQGVSVFHNIRMKKDVVWQLVYIDHTFIMIEHCIVIDLLFKGQLKCTWKKINFRLWKWFNYKTKNFSFHFLKEEKKQRK